MKAFGLGSRHEQGGKQVKNGFAANTSRLAAAQRYLARGWQPVPVPAESKNPGFLGWPKFRVNGEVEKFFSDPGNIGILTGEPSGGLIDVDVDSLEAGVLASKFLPQTNAVFGRAGKPSSHRLYIVKDFPPTEQFQDTNGAMLVELRSSGIQTIFPPSVHPTKENYEWIKEGDPLTIEAKPLVHYVSYLATATLLVRHYPAKGSRHEFALALSGGL